MNPVLPALALGIVVLGLLFRPEAMAAVRVWNTSTAYGHCWLILPISAWLLWERRAALRTTPIRPVLWPAALALPLVLIWAAAAGLGVMEIRQLAAIAFLLVLLLAVLGAQLWWAWSAGLLYLVFLVPFGAFLTPVLQHVTAWFVGTGLDVLGIPNSVSALQIDIPEGSFYVAEACAGLRFLIASIAFGVLFAVTMFQSPGRRAGFILAACLIPVIANGFRGLGIVVLGHVLGSAQAAAADHVIYGWVFFSVVLVLLACAGLPFRQATPPSPAPSQGVLRAPGWHTPLRAALPVLALAACSQAALRWMESRRAAAAAISPAIWVAPPGCTASGEVTPGAVTEQRFLCGGATVLATTIVLPRRVNPAEVVANARRLAGANIADPDASILALPNASWGLLTESNTGHAGAYLLWIDGAPAIGGLRDRWHLGRDLILGSATAPVVVTAAANTETTLRNFLAGQSDLAQRMTAASSAALQP